MDTQDIFGTKSQEKTSPLSWKINFLTLRVSRTY